MTDRTATRIAWLISALAIGFVILCLSGCMFPNFEKLSDKLLAKDASFVLEHNARTGQTTLTVAAPRIGYSVKAGDVSVAVPTNVSMQVQHLVFPPGASNVVINGSTNRPTQKP